MNLSTKINNIRQENAGINALEYEVIQLFQEVLQNKSYQNKKEVLNQIYDSLLPPSFRENFISRSSQLLNENSEYLDWFLSRLSSNPEDVVSLTKRIKDQAIVNKIIKTKLSDLTQEDFNEKLIKPLYITSHKSTANPLTFFVYYLNRYEINFFSAIKDYQPRKQEQLIKRFIKHGLLKADYDELNQYVPQFSQDIRDEIYGYIFKCEKDLNLFKSFENKYWDLLSRDCFDVNHISLAVHDREKRNYIIDNYFVFPKVDSSEHLNRAIDCSLVREGQTKRDESEFSSFVNRLTTRHLNKSHTLRAEQFCIIVKRCYDFGFIHDLNQMLTQLRENDKEMYVEINRTIQTYPIMEINRFTKLDFTTPALKEKLHELYVSYLDATLETKTYQPKGIKI